MSIPGKKRLEKQQGAEGYLFFGGLGGEGSACQLSYLGDDQASEGYSEKNASGGRGTRYSEKQKEHPACGTAMGQEYQREKSNPPEGLFSQRNAVIGGKNRSAWS